MERLGDFTALMRKERPARELAPYVWLLMKYGGKGVAGLFAAASEAPRFDLRGTNIAAVLKSAVAAGGTTDAGWAAELSPYRGLTAEWADLVRHQTFFGKLPYVRAAFNTATVVSNVFSASWVTEGAAIPFSKNALAKTGQLPMKKVAGLVAFDDEIFESWSPATEQNITDRMTTAAIYATEYSALDPNIAATTAAPASLLYGVSPTQTTGGSASQVVADFRVMLQRLIDGGSDLKRTLIVLSPTTALYLSALQTSNGDYAFPSLTVNGGNVWGVPVAVSSAAAQVGSPATHLVAAIDGAKVVVADDGIVLFDASRATSLQMADAPSGAANGVSMFQTHTRVLRVVKVMNWTVADSSGIAWFPVGF